MKQPSEIFTENVEQINQVIRSLCRRHGIFGSDQDDLVSVIRLRLVEDDYHIIRQFRQQSKLSTYLHTVISRLFIDCRRQSEGRWRPSLVAHDLGETATKLEELLNREHYTIEEAFSIMTTNYHISVTMDELCEIAAKLPMKTLRLTVDTGDDLLDKVSSTNLSPDNILQNSQEEKMRQALYAVIEDVRESLSAEERLIFALRYEDDRPISEIARTLGENRTKIARMLDSILGRIRETVKSRGILADDVQDILARSNQISEAAEYIP